MENKIKTITQKVADEFIEKHSDIINEALCDYIRWYDDDEEQFKHIQEAIDDLEDVR
ncbi:MAG: hypothetical protein KAQ89_00630 [Planctomycetes bacterium]|nr:hypothetical protein [Planctomycetota bacterium]